MSKELCQDCRCEPICAMKIVHTTEKSCILKCDYYIPENIRGDIEWVRDWLLPGREVTNIDIQSCIRLLNDILEEISP